jgi:hypothetical protein
MTSSWPGHSGSTRSPLDRVAALGCLAVGRQDAERAITGTADRPEVAFIQRQEVDAVMSLGENDQGCVRESKVQVPIAGDDLRGPNHWGVGRYEVGGSLLPIAWLRTDVYLRDLAGPRINVR